MRVAYHKLVRDQIPGITEAGRKRAERGGFDSRIFLEYVDQAR
jgi:predicted house-cleaning noncanonical NTP pyrophosphatase (MazG superfamily)